MTNTQGKPAFKQFSNEQLRAFIESVDKHVFSENFEACRSEIEKRKTSGTWESKPLKVEDFDHLPTFSRQWFLNIHLPGTEKLPSTPEITHWRRFNFLGKILMGGAFTILSGIALIGLTFDTSAPDRESGIFIFAIAFLFGLALLFVKPFVHRFKR